MPGQIHGFVSEFTNGQGTELACTCTLVRNKATSFCRYVYINRSAAWIAEKSKKLETAAAKKSISGQLDDPSIGLYFVIEYNSQWKLPCLILPTERCPNAAVKRTSANPLASYRPFFTTTSPLKRPLMTSSNPAIDSKPMEGAESHEAMLGPPAKVEPGHQGYHRGHSRHEQGPAGRRGSTLRRSSSASKASTSSRKISTDCARGTSRSEQSTQC